MSNTTLAAADLLDKAADAIEERGWGQHDYHRNGQQFCFLGSLSYAKTGAPEFFFDFAQRFPHGNSWDQWKLALGEEDPVLLEAVLAFEDMILDELAALDYSDHDYTVVLWNDSVATNGQQVVAKLRAAALLLRTKNETAIEQKELVTA